MLQKHGWGLQQLLLVSLFWNSWLEPRNVERSITRQEQFSLFGEWTVRPRKSKFIFSWAHHLDASEQASQCFQILLFFLLEFVTRLFPFVYVAGWFFDFQRAGKLVIHLLGVFELTVVRRWYHVDRPMHNELLHPSAEPWIDCWRPFNLNDLANLGRFFKSIKSWINWVGFTWWQLIRNGLWLQKSWKSVHLMIINQGILILLHDTCALFKIYFIF